MLIAFEVVGVPPDFGDHVLQTRVVCKHAVGTLEGRRRQTTVRLSVCTGMGITAWQISGPLMVWKT